MAISTPITVNVDSTLLPELRRLQHNTDLLSEQVRDLTILVQRIAHNVGHEQTARQLGELIDRLDPDPGYAEGQEPFGVPA